MDYTLLKQLKDAGFPLVSFTSGVVSEPFFKIDGIAYFTPTLSELIEAVGTDLDKPVFKMLTMHSKWKNGIMPTHDGKVDMNEVGRWCAKARVNEKRENGKWVKEIQWGHTAEEAVAKLWLALNKK